MFKFLKYIIDLKKENVLLNRAILDAVIMLTKREVHKVQDFDNNGDWLLNEVRNILNDFKNIQQQQ